MGQVTQGVSSPRVSVLCAAGASDAWRRVLGADLVTPTPEIASDAEWVLIADPGTIPEPQVIRELLAAVPAGGAAAFAAHMVVDADGRPVRSGDPGGWSTERSRWVDYTGPVALVRSAAVVAIGGQGALNGERGVGAAAPLGTAAVRRAALRHAARFGAVGYCPRALVMTRSWDAIALPADETAKLLADAGAPFTLAADGRTRVGVRPSISAVIPTRGSMGEVGGRSVRFLDRALESLTADSYSSELEIVLVVDTDAASQPGLAGSLRRWRDQLGRRLRVVDHDPPFNFSVKVNKGVAAASSEVVAVLNDDIEVVTTGALASLSMAAMEADVGAVGALLHYEDGSIQHAGQAFADGGVHHVGTTRKSAVRFWEGPGGLLVDRDVVGVTAACLVQRREVWDRVGGFDPMLPVNFNDVEYCWRIRQHGLRIVQCNSVELRHFESQTRRPGAHPWEVERLRGRVGSMFHDDFTPAAAVGSDNPGRDRMRYRLRSVGRRLRRP